MMGGLAPHLADRRAGLCVQAAMAYRDDLTALSARHDALAAELEHKTQELEDSRRLLEQARARARLPVLDNIRVATPCSADWNEMTGDGRTRHCGECKQDVYHLSGLTRDEAEALVTERNGQLCVRYFQRQDGTILFADCAVGVRRRRRRRRWVAAGAAALLAGGAGVGGRLHHDATTPEMLEPERISELPPPVPEPPPAAPAHGRGVEVKMGRMILTR